jgi:predicted Zn-dependent protease
VGINAGTILLAQSEDELAGVLSHEITHISQHHLARAMENARGSTLTALATVAAALVAGTMGHGDAAVPGLMVAQSLNIENQLGYTRENEREADRIGMQVLHSANYDPQAMPRFLTRMSKQQIDLFDGRFSYLRTHPINEERIADAKSRADHYPVHPPKSSLTFDLMKSRLLVLSGQYSPSKLKTPGMYSSKKNNTQTLAQRYAQALLLHRGRKLQEAEKQMRALHEEHPENSLFTLGLAEIYTDQHQPINAEILLEQPYALNHDNPPLLLSYSSVIMQFQNNKKALALLYL